MESRRIGIIFREDGTVTGIIPVRDQTESSSTDDTELPSELINRDAPPSQLPKRTA